MRKLRFHVDELPTVVGSTLEISGEEAHHAVTVLRLRVGSEVELFDGRGGAGTFRVSGVAKSGITVALVARTDDDRESKCAITLAVAPPRPKRLLSLVEKATELGVARIVPIETERTRAPLPDKALPKLERRAIEAAKQCWRNRIPTFAGSHTLAELIAKEKPSHELALLPDPRGGKPLREVLREEPGAPPKSVLFAIGPEGGFTDRETETLRGAGFRPVVLGRSVLRVETAALACLVYELG